MYADLTRTQRDELVRQYRGARQLGATDACHAVACAANDVLVKTNRGWNGKAGANAFAAAMASLVMDKVIRLA